jgi:hypothetical protein
MLWAAKRTKLLVRITRHDCVLPPDDHDLWYRVASTLLALVFSLVQARAEPTAWTDGRFRFQPGCFEYNVPFYPRKGSRWRSPPYPQASSRLRLWSRDHSSSERFGARTRRQHRTSLRPRAWGPRAPADRMPGPAEPTAPGQECSARPQEALRGRPSGWSWKKGWGSCCVDPPPEPDGLVRAFLSATFLTPSRSPWTIRQAWKLDTDSSHRVVTLVCEPRCRLSLAARVRGLQRLSRFLSSAPTPRPRYSESEGVKVSIRPQTYYGTVQAGAGHAPLARRCRSTCFASTSLTRRLCILLILAELNCSVHL